MKITDEQLSAYLDGELPVNEMRAIEAALASNVGLAERLQDLAEASDAVKSAMDPVLDEPIPDHILAMIDGKEADAINDNAASNVVEIARFRPGKILSRWATPIAASLAMVAGLGIGQTLTADNSSSDVLYAQMSGTVSPDNPLFAVLEHTPSAQAVTFSSDQGVSVKPVLTFATTEGYCREFSAQSRASALRGVACRGEKNWDIVLLNRAEIAGTEGYHTASGASEVYIDQLIDNLITGIPLGAGEELALLQSGWTSTNTPD